MWRIRRDLLNQLLHGVHNVNIMMSLDHLRQLLGGSHSMEHLQMRSDYLISIHTQILRLFLHVVEEEAADVVDKDVCCHICSDMINVVLVR